MLVIKLITTKVNHFIKQLNLIKKNQQLSLSISRSIAIITISLIIINPNIIGDEKNKLSVIYSSLRNINFTYNGLSIPVDNLKLDTKPKFKNFVIVSIVIIAGLTALIIFLLVNIIRGKKIERILKSLTEAGPDGLLVHALDGKILYCNKVFHNKYGYTYNEITKMNIKEIDTLDSSRQYNERLKNQIKGKVYSCEIFFRAKNGRVIPVECNTTLSSYHGKPAILSVVRDITDRKNSEREKELLLKELANKNEELESLLYAASHDLRSPLVNIQGFSNELLLNCKEIENIVKDSENNKKGLKNLSPIIKNEIPEALNYIISNSDKMNKLLKGLFKLSRLGQSALELQSIDMNEVIKYIIHNMHYKIKNVKAVITVKKLPGCIGDKTQIIQVFTNLIDNSIKFVKVGQKVTINISGEKKKKESIYCIKDSGIGIDPSHHKKIFELFHRLNPAKEIYGEGMGLTISKRIIENHTGKIWLESEEGKGTSFYITLPNEINQ